MVCFILYIYFVLYIQEGNSFCHSFKLRHVARVKPAHCDNINSNNAANHKGLLSGISDIEKAEYYSDGIIIKKSYELLKDTKHIFNICVNNAGGNTTLLEENLANMRETAKKFIKSDAVWNRKQLISTLDDIVMDEGRFVCLLAGKNTGKSLFLRNLEKRFPSKVFLVKLRVHPNILIGLVMALRDRKHSDMTEKAKDILKLMVAKFIKRYTVIDDIFKDEDFQKYVDIASKKSDPAALPTLINDLVDDLGRITLVIDEANIAFTTSDRTSEVKIDATKEALALFTTLTKEQLKINVILVSSEHVFPLRLYDPRLSFHPNNFNGYIYAGEVPPKDMYDLLTVEWGVKSNLAIALIDIFGGHIYDMQQALTRLYQDKEEFWLMDSALNDNVRMCLEWKGGKWGDTERMRDALQQLATIGFYPIDKSTDLLAKVISENNVSGVVRKSAKAIGLRADVWETTKFKHGIVPSKQSMRLAIAKVLEE